MCTGEGQWKPASDLSREGRGIVSHPPSPPGCASLRGCRAAVSPACSEGSCGTRKPPGQEGTFRPLGILCVFIAGARLTSLALKLGSAPCSEAVFAICHSLAPSLAKFSSRISCSKALGWETRVRAHCIFAQPRGTSWPSLGSGGWGVVP